MSKVETEGAAGPNPTRPDPATVLKAIPYFTALKDIHANVKGAVEGAVAGGSADSLPDSITSMKRSRTCIDFLTSIDQTGELTDSTIIPFDVIKHQRDVRAEKASKEMDTESYLEFSKARRASFVSPKSAAKFREWLKLKSDDDGEIPKILKTAYELLGFVAYELVAELVELALIVRKDKARGMNQPFSRYMPGIGYSSTGGVDSREAEMTSPLTPAEFHEAIRRCRSSPVGHANLFTRRPNGNTYPPLLSF
ncbi:hypothetical protein C0J52_05874 [Blattella germanica]|nr:hypothetical protein C0J52_05874 [Blattella germanica]